MVLLDSNVFIAYFRIEEEYYKKANDIIHDSTQIVINDYVLSEIYTVLLLRESYDIAKKAINWIISNSNIIVSKLYNQEIENIINFINNNKTSLSYVDISLIIMCKYRNYELISFDQELVKIAEVY